MTAQTLMVVIAIAGILANVVTAFFVVRISVAVLEERLNGHKEATSAKFGEQDRHHESTDREVSSLRERVHSHASMLQSHEVKIRQLETNAKGGTR